MLETDENWTNQFLTETLSGNTGFEEKIEPELNLDTRLGNGSAVDLGKG